MSDEDIKRGLSRIVAAFMRGSTGQSNLIGNSDADLPVYNASEDTLNGGSGGNIIMSMINRHWLLGALKTISLILTLGISMSACSATMSWKEEVQLHDGGTLVVERFYNLGGYPTLDSRERSAIDETMTFNLPGTNKNIIWKTDFLDSVPETNSLNLLLLDVVNGVPYIATYPAGCIAYNKWQRPNPPYVFFKYDGNDWKRISLEEFPWELTKSNTIVGRPPSDLLKPFYNASQVQERNHYLQPEYKTILREPYAGAAGRCSEMIRTNDGWEGLGFFKLQKSYEACLKYCERKGVNQSTCPCEILFKGAK